VPTRPATARAWEHKMVDITTMGRAELKTVLDKEGADGWELAAIDPGSAARGERTAILKRQKNPGGNVSSGSGMTSSGMGMAPGSVSGPATTTPAPRGSANTPSGSSFGDTTTPVVAASGASNYALHTIPLQAATATNAATVLKELLAIGEFPGVTAVIADADTNSLIVKANDKGLKAIAERAKKLDESAAVKRKEDELNSKRKP
jgi:Bacterial type II/III secretion system short domain